MSQPPTSPLHPLVACRDGLRALLAAARASDPAYLPEAERAEVLRDLTVLGSQLEALRLRTLAVCDDVAAEHACRTAADWLSSALPLDPKVTHAQQRLADALDQRFPTLAAALADGSVLVDQARVIVKALEALPAQVGREVTVLAEKQLIDDAAALTPSQLARVGRRVLDVVAPEVGDDQERRALERAEQRAEAVIRLDFRVRGDGSTDITATVPDHDAARLKTYLEAYTSPHQGHGTDPATGIRRTASHQRAHAFTALLEHLDPATLPAHGGLATTLMVTMPLTGLLSGLGTANLLGTDIDLSPGEARRLACNAGLVPAVLGTNSEVLDLGRSNRFHSPGQRKALALESPHCRAEGCTVPAAWCQAHHEIPWSQGGRTDLETGLLLCHWHHKRAHDPRYATARTPNGDVRYHRRR